MKKNKSNASCLKWQARGVLKIILLGLASHLALAATATGPAPSTSQAGNLADTEWQMLKSLGKLEVSGPKKNEGKSSPQARVTTFLDQANQLRSFYTRNPTHSEAKQAKRLETLSLNYAALYGDRSQEQRRGQLVEEIRKDAALSANEKFEVVAWSQQVAISRQQPADRVSRSGAHEGAARSLISEFPSVSDGYESLLAVARDIGPERGKVILKDLQAMANVPAAVRAEAQATQDRFALVGKKVGDLLPKNVAGEMRISLKGKVAVLYTWSAMQSSSQALAKRLSRLEGEYAIVGINVDAQSSAAKLLATQAKLPGTNFYKEAGIAGEVASALKLSSTPTVYLIDAGGVIRDVNGLNNLTEKLTGLKRKRGGK